jgi:protein SCO1/2
MPTNHLVRVTALGVMLLAAHMAPAAGANEQHERNGRDSGYSWSTRGSRDSRYSMSGMVMKVAPSRKSFAVSHDSVPGVMEAMTMTFEVREPKELDGVVPGMTVEFTLVLEQDSGYAEQVRIRRYEAVDQDPLTATRLKLLKEMTSAPSSTVKALAVGQAVPDFTLTDQARHTVTLSDLRGKVVAITFIYTSCTLPQLCFRLANQFGVIHKRFTDRMGRDLILLTVTFDPVRDQPERLADYASQWNANPATWHFLTGAVPDIARVCGLFGVDFFPDEGLMDHSSHTALIDRQGHLVANIEGNQFTATQLGDLVDVTLSLRD